MYLNPRPVVEEEMTEEESREEFVSPSKLVSAWYEITSATQTVTEPDNKLRLGSKLLLRRCPLKRIQLTSPY